MSTLEPNEADPTRPIDQSVWPPPPANQPEYTPDIPPFKQQNVLVLILLYVCTLGLYTIYWLYRQIQAVNTVAGTALVSPFAVWIVAIMHIANMAGAFANVSQDTDRLIQLGSNVVWITVFFMLRTGLNRAMGVREGDRAYVGKLGTFFRVNSNNSTLL